MSEHLISTLIRTNLHRTGGEAREVVLQLDLTQETTKTVVDDQLRVDQLKVDHLKVNQLTGGQTESRRFTTCSNLV